MAALRDLYQSAGHRDVTTYVQSGNVVSTTTSKRATAVAQGIELAIADHFGLEVVVLVRTPAEMARVLTRNPFAAGQPDPTKLAVTFLQGDPAPEAVAGIDATKYAPDDFTVDGREVYVHCPNGYGRTRINTTFFEQKLGVAATTRNWRTVDRLVELAPR
jgi:uncharacterized protein (DUF1697 family)